MDTRREGDLFIVWRPPSVPGLQVRNLNSLIQQQGNDQFYYDFRIILDFEFDLL